MDDWRKGIKAFDRNLSRRMARIREKEINAGRECCHGLLEGTCSLCLGHPQSKVLEGPPYWATRRRIV